MFWHAHAHSEFSCLDALSEVEPMVAKAARFGQPAMALTDHGNMSGSVQLYKAGKKHGIQVFPGIEGYLVQDTQDKEAKRYHVGLLALDIIGYRALVRLSSESHKRENFHRFPRFDWGHLAQLSDEAKDHVALTTGCYFGLFIQTLVNGGYTEAEGVLKTYAHLFPHTYVEVQDHGIKHDTGLYDHDIVDTVIGLADTAGLPVIATQDVHYLDESHKFAHELMKRSTYGGKDPEFPGQSFHLASGEWVMRHYGTAEEDRIIEGLNDLLSKNQVVLPALDAFTFHVPSLSDRPNNELSWALRKVLRGMPVEYKQRADYEFEVIKKLGIANYLLIWKNIVDWCRQKHILIEARGSANNSLVCYLLGITQTDPIRWNLMFERFLSYDRTKPPDIDMDVEDINRERLVAYIGKHYPTVHIGTFSSLGSRDDGKGSVLVTYLSGLKKQLPDDEYRVVQRSIKTISDVQTYRMLDYVALRNLASQSARRSYGVHAAGLLVGSPTQAIEDYVPTMLVASSDTTVTQYTMKDVEQLGYLKLDILGVRNLTVLRRCQELIGKDNPLDFSWIPADDKQALQALKSGRPNTGIFQFDGYAMAKGGKAMGIKSVEDVVLAGALFRPAVMDEGLDDLYIRRRKNSHERKAVTYPHPVFEKNLKPTHGIVVFQEQVIQIMRDLGMTIAGINVFFDAVKDSARGSHGRNADRFGKVYQEFSDLCAKNGIKDVEGAWSYIEGYVSYGFNQGHSTGYGIRSYRGAYLKAHYPLEYMTALLESNVGTTKEKDYVIEARKMGIRILPPDVNISGTDYTIDRGFNAIRRGLTSIKGVGESAAAAVIEAREQEGGFTSVESIIERVPARAVSGGKQWLKDGTWTGTLRILRDAGALGSLEDQ